MGLCEHKVGTLKKACLTGADEADGEQEADNAAGSGWAENTVLFSCPHISVHVVFELMQDLTAHV